MKPKDKITVHKKHKPTWECSTNGQIWPRTRKIQIVSPKDALKPNLPASQFPNQKQEMAIC